VSIARYEVQIVNPATGKPKTFSTHDNREAAEVEAGKLRRHGFFVQVRRVDDDPYSSRRRFLIAMFMAGWIKPERVVERIAAEVETETTL
jgi:hypothetical protein